MKIETLAVHAGHAVDESTGAVAAPIQLSTTFERAADGSYPHGFVYSRSDNPNRRALEQAMAALEGGAESAAFGSGLAATAAVFQSLRPGDHVIAPIEGYHGALKQLREVFVPWGLSVDFVDMTNLPAVEKAVRTETKLIWTETPSNPQLKITDLAAVAKIAHQAGALCACDNTWAPIVQRPLDLGLDFVVHSTTKYIGGHSDVTSGVVVAKVPNEQFVADPSCAGIKRRAFHRLSIAGWSCAGYALCHGGCGPIRKTRSRSRSFLSQHEKIERVNYPGLTSSHGHEIASRQMSAFSGMLSFEVKGGREGAMKAAAQLKVFIRATSLGGVESLVEHRASIAGESPDTPQGLLRASIGLEHPDDLIEDLEQALASA